jgi:hypothetical protein
MIKVVEEEVVIAKAANNLLHCVDDRAFYALSLSLK